MPSVVPLDPSVCCCTGSPSRLCCSGFGTPAWGYEPTLPSGGGSFAANSTGASKLSTSSKGLPISVFPPLLPVSVLFLQCFLDKYGQFATLLLVFFQVDNAIFSCKSSPLLGGKALRLLLQHSHLPLNGSFLDSSNFWWILVFLACNSLTTICCHLQMNFLPYSLYC